MKKEVVLSLSSAFLLVLLLVPLVTRAARRAAVPMKEELEEHRAKAGTPQLGGLAMLPAFMLGMVYFSSERTAQISMISAVLFALIGYADDFMKIHLQSSDGLKSLHKLLLQCIAAAAISFLVRENAGLYEKLPSCIYYPSAIIYICAIVNSVNIVDGLDSLCIKSCAPALVMVAIALPGAGPAPAVMLAVLVGFLFFNSKSATIFMGDGGSHLVGGAVASVFLLSEHPLICLVALALPLVEMLSSFVQIFSIRVFRRKVFLIAPLHHAFQKNGMEEEKIADRFLCVSAFFSLLAAYFL